MSTSCHRRFGPRDILSLRPDILEGALSRSRTRTPCIQAGVGPQPGPNANAHRRPDSPGVPKMRLRREAFPLRRAFLQHKRCGETRPGPLTRFVSAGDRTRLLLYFLAPTSEVKDTQRDYGPWSCAVSDGSPSRARATTAVGSS